MNKKADMEFDTVLKLILGLIILLIVIGLIFLFKGKSTAMTDKIRDIFRFGP